MSDHFEERLKNHRPRALTTDEREFLWSRIEERLYSRMPASDGQHPERSFLRRLVALSTIAGLLLGGSVATVYASNDALPGETLFSVKLAAERMRLAVVSQAKADDLRISFAERRLDEVEEAAKRSAGRDAALAAKGTVIPGAGAPFRVGVPGVSTEEADTALRLPRAIARNELERTKQEFLAKGNDRGALLLDDIIDDLDDIDSRLLAPAGDFRGRPELFATASKALPAGNSSQKHNGGIKTHPNSVTGVQRAFAVLHSATMTFPATSTVSGADSPGNPAVSDAILIENTDTKPDTTTSDSSSSKKRRSNERQTRLVACPPLASGARSVEIDARDVRRFLRTGGNLAECARAGTDVQPAALLTPNGRSGAAVSADHEQGDMPPVLLPHFHPAADPAAPSFVEYPGSSEDKRTDDGVLLLEVHELH